jgi:hypothetical protein
VGWWLLLALVIVVGGLYGASRLQVLPATVQTPFDRASAWVGDAADNTAGWLSRARTTLFGYSGGQTVTGIPSEQQPPVIQAASPTAPAESAASGASPVPATATHKPDVATATQLQPSPTAKTSGGGAVAQVSTDTAAPPTQAPTATGAPPTEVPTYTPLPTYTPYPTFTLVPSSTPLPPTATTVPTPVGPRGRIAYTENKGNFAYDIYTINVDGTGKQLLVANASEPSFTKDGQYLFYNWTGNGVDIRRMDGSGQRRVINDGEAAFANLAMDNYTIIYMTGEVNWDRWGWAMNVYTIVLDGSNKRFITEGDQPA